MSNIARCVSEEDVLYGIHDDAGSPELPDTADQKTQHPEWVVVKSHIPVSCKCGSNLTPEFQYERATTNYGWFCSTCVTLGGNKQTQATATQWEDENQHFYDIPSTHSKPGSKRGVVELERQTTKNI
jgi:hypothetical protein